LCRLRILGGRFWLFCSARPAARMRWGEWE
jgi:hypothetical protein